MSDKKGYNKWKVIVLSFTGAIIFWFFSALGKDYNHRIKYPIYIDFDRDSLVSVIDMPAYLEIDVAGGGWDLFRQTFWFSADPVTIDLENPVTTSYLTQADLLPILTEQLDQFKINFLLLDTLKLAIDRRGSKRIFLVVDSAAINLDENYRITSSITIEPDTVTLFGPESYLDTLENEYIFKLPNKQIDKSYDRYVEFGIPEEFGIYSNPPVVNVLFDVDLFEEVTMVVPLELLNFPENQHYSFSDTTTNVQFSIAEKQREEVSFGDFKVLLDYHLLNAQDSAIPLVMLFYPEQALDIEMSPDSIFFYAP